MKTILFFYNIFIVYLGILHRKPPAPSLQSPPTPLGTPPPPVPRKEEKEQNSNKKQFQFLLTVYSLMQGQTPGGPAS